MALARVGGRVWKVRGGAGRDLGFVLRVDLPGEWGRKAVSAPFKPSVSQAALVVECLCCCYYYYEYSVFVLLSVCMVVHALCLWRPEEGVRFPGTGVTDGCEPSSMDAGNPT